MVLNWKRIAMDSVLLFAFTFLGGLIVGFGAGMLDATLSLAMLGIVNFLAATIGFAYISYRTRHNRWPHLLVVALIFWLIGLVNVILGFADLWTWVTSIISALIFMALGGGIGMALRYAY